MYAALQRLRSGQRWLAADLAIRTLGCGLLGLCAAAVWWLYTAVQHAPSQPADLRDLAAAMLAVLCWAGGWVALAEGQKLFQLVEIPGRDGQIDPINKGISL
ncbi:hypothetical protein ACFO8O_03700 [Hephaestia sp. GCM10023244]|uniref:hypothetical protein n=1 Tax=unclassified Hephaestia TaxID=2631281 RepID=UPI0020772FD1|nr:hypothetical protein [Hephaestia sp. MAHUQ-44]MCM8730075.1 hypothetical protein [Hephaestia sp. MAHUQ-44]